jgi:hypothetical protein
VEYMKDGPEGERAASKLEAVDVGIDEDAELITSCFIVPADNEAVTRPGKPVKLSENEKAAKRELESLIATGGAVPPATEGVPPNKVCTTFERWREQAYRIGVGDTKTAAARRMAFNRIAVKLHNNGLIGRSHSLVWLA